MNNKLQEHCHLAVDTSDRRQFYQWFDAWAYEFEWFKIGMQSFYQFGPEVISFLKQERKRVFLDLKLHDIPNTVAGAIQSLGQYQVDMLTLHLNGGSEMLKAALDGRDRYMPRTKIMGVSYLTSISQKQYNHELFYSGLMQSNLFQLAKNSIRLGLDGLVCAATDLSSFQSVLNCELLTPGIRWRKTDDDQKRVLGPKEALKLGSDYLVIGRGLTQANNPREELKVLKELLQ
jgi:orotidine-5'-phosphate decarboxylase